MGISLRIDYDHIEKEKYVLNGIKKYDRLPIYEKKSLDFLD